MSIRPNVLWIFCDELRTDALGCYGNPYMQPATPAIDSIAATGSRFDRCYVNSPVCVPSRMAMLTGLYPEQTGVYHNEAAWPHFRLAQRPDTFPEAFARHGYRTADFGKLHLPLEMEPWQTHDGTGSGMRGPTNGVDPASFVRTAGVGFVVGGRYDRHAPYPPARTTDRALTWLAEAAASEQPFLLRLSVLQPHTPVVVPEPFASRYAAAPFPDRTTIPAELSAFERRFGEINGGEQMTPEAFVAAQVYYHGLVAWVDSQVGRVLDFLRERRMLESTIILFSADHGALLGEAGAYGKQIFAPWSQRIPLLLSWPGTLPAGAVRGDLCEGLDTGRTLLGLAGIEAPAQFHGRNLAADPAPEAVFATIGYGLPESRAFPNGARGTFVDRHGEHGWPRRSCVRTGRFRLDRTTRLDGRPPSAEEEDTFLADTQNDPFERRNLAADPAYAGTLAQLSALLSGHVRGAVEPTPELVRLDEGERPPGLVESINFLG